MTFIFCLWLANQWLHTLQEQADTVALDLGAVVYNTIVAATMLTQLILWAVYMKLQADLSSPALSYDFYDNRETSRARFLLPYKIDNASSTAVDSGGDEAFAGNLRWPLKTNNTGLETYAAMLHSMNVLQTLQVHFCLALVTLRFFSSSSSSSSSCGSEHSDLSNALFRASRYALTALLVQLLG